MQLVVAAIAVVAAAFAIVADSAVETSTLAVVA